MAKIPIGLILRQIVDEKRITNKFLIEALGISKQAVYNNFKRTDMTTSELNKWADALGVTQDYILTRATTEPVEEKGADSGYLADYVKHLESTLAAQLVQISGLQRTVDALLSAKLRGVIRLRTTPIIPMHSTTMAFAV